MKRKIPVLIFAFLGFLGLAVWNASAGNVYHIDLMSSAIRFKVIHMGIPFVRGRFEKFDGTTLWEGDQLTEFDGTVDMTTLKTGIKARDNDLKSDNFFAVQKFPSMTIKSRTITQIGNTVKIQSDLTIRDITHPIDLQGNVSRGERDNTIILKLKGVINRMDYGLKLPKLFEFFIGNNVNISLDLHAHN